MIELKNIYKKIGQKVILDDISYQFEYGRVYGLCGPNGSGKTMLLRAVAGLIIADRGEVVIDQKVLHKDISVAPETGIMIENMELLSQYNAFDNLKLLSKIRKKATDEDILKALERVGLHSDLKVKKYSLGMKQRLNIAQAIFEKPKIILLDEPTNALDEGGIELFRKIVEEEKERGAVLLIATHHKEDLQNLCDKILKIEEGRMYDKQDV